jgi:fumarate reductase iron-sulfur subunit
MVRDLTELVPQERAAHAVTLRVFRWSPGERERSQAYEIPAGPDTTVLDALVEIQRGQDPTLAFRYACRVGMCGSCAMVVNGRERWACRTRLASLDTAIDVRPLYHFPVLRDLVVDMTPFFDRLRGVGAALEPAPAAPAYAEISRDAVARREIDAAIECIGCGMCVSACTIAARHPRFPGPAALNRAFTLQLDSRDAEREARWQVLLSDDALWRCHGQGNCTEVCPMGLAPTTSIIRLRQMAARRLVAALRAWRAPAVSPRGRRA